MITCEPSIMVAFFLIPWYLYWFCSVCVGTCTCFCFPWCHSRVAVLDIRVSLFSLSRFIVPCHCKSLRSTLKDTYVYNMLILALRICPFFLPLFVLDIACNLWPGSFRFLIIQYWFSYNPILPYSKLFPFLLELHFLWCISDHVTSLSKVCILNRVILTLRRQKLILEKWKSWIV